LVLESVLALESIDKSCSFSF